LSTIGVGKFARRTYHLVTAHKRVAPSTCPPARGTLYSTDFERSPMPDPTPSAAGPRDEIVHELRRRIDTALAARDRAGAVSSALASVRSGDIEIVDLYSLVITPLLVDTGAAWQVGTAVWEEHFASATVRTIIEALYLDVVEAAAKVPRRAQHVLLANPPQEQHDLGLRMLADRFELAGYPVTFLGANTPLDEIAAAARATNAEVVILSIATMYERVELREFLELLHEKIPNVRLRVGGAAFAHDRDWPVEELLDPEEFGLVGTPSEGPS